MPYPPTESRIASRLNESFATLSGAKLTLRLGALARFFSRRGRIHIEKINGPFLFREKGAPAEYKAGLDLAIDRNWRGCTRAGPM